LAIIYVGYSSFDDKFFVCINKPGTADLVLSQVGSKSLISMTEMTTYGSSKWVAVHCKDVFNAAQE
jgi:hypothetical protein